MSDAEEWVLCSGCKERMAKVQRKLRNQPEPYTPIVTVELNLYQAANLLSHMKDVWHGIIPVGVGAGGDWQGEVPIVLERAMREAGGEFLVWKPNSQKDPFR